MIILPNKGLGFISVTKCASTTIEAALSEKKGVFVGGTTGLKHTKYRLVERYILPFLETKGVEKPHFFAVTRDPADRLLSWYKYRQRDQIANASKNSRIKQNYTGDITFEEFALGAIGEDPEAKFKIETQKSFLLGEAKEIEVGTLIKVEAVDTLLPVLLDAFDIEAPKTLERKNISPTPVSAVMSDDLRAKINESETFKDDFALYQSSASTHEALLETIKTIPTVKKRLRKKRRAERAKLANEN